VEISGTELPMGSVTPVKALGALAMIDDGELDWKIVCIAASHPLASKLNDVEDVEREMPGELQKIMEWFRDYKIPDGKPANKFGWGGKTQGAAFTAGVIEETHGFWKALKVEGTRENDDGYAL
jgi:inorganic pyrophosphatase